jgi:hypothetical protein
MAMEIATALLLVFAFSGGYGLREWVSRQRRSAAKKRYVERKAAEKILLNRIAPSESKRTSASYRIAALANSVGARTYGGA